MKFVQFNVVFPGGKQYQTTRAIELCSIASMVEDIEKKSKHGIANKYYLRIRGTDGNGDKFCFYSAGDKKDAPSCSTITYAFKETFQSAYISHWLRRIKQENKRTYVAYPKEVEIELLEIKRNTMKKSVKSNGSKVLQVSTVAKQKPSNTAKTDFFANDNKPPVQSEDDTSSSSLELEKVDIDSLQRSAPFLKTN